VRHKKFKWYKSHSQKKKLLGVLDFERIQCMIMIDDEETSLYKGVESEDEEETIQEGF
jgi:hypothetical protein